MKRSGSALLIAGFVSAVLVLGAPLTALAFGNSGQRGQDGSSGRDGENGQNVTITAGEQVQELLLSGGDGMDGYDGTRGGYATDCYYDYVDRDQYGADGGDGGSGGHGGDGGNGGDVTVYHTDTKQLRNIRIVSEPGWPGRGGMGASGGEACRCNGQQTWTAVHCDRDFGKVSCGEQNYSCYDGDDGRSGWHGMDGRPGRHGIVSTIKSATVLPEVYPNAVLDLEKVDPIADLSENLWNARKGAQQLFATGSKISDEYREYTRQYHTKATIRWAASRPIADMAGHKIAVSLATKAVTFTPDKGVILDSEQTFENGLHVLTIREAILASEFDQVQIGNASGKGTGLSLELKDPAGVLDPRRTKLTIAYVAGNYIYRTELTESVLEKGADASTTDVRIGKLAIKAKYLEPKRFLLFKWGRKVRIVLGVERKMGSETVRFERELDYKVPRREQ